MLNPPKTYCSKEYIKQKEMELLQAAHDHSVNAMNDVSFTVGDMVTIGAVTASAIGLFVKMQINSEKQNAKIAALELGHEQEKLLLQSEAKAAKDGRIYLKKELFAKIKDEHDLSKNRIDKTQDALNKYKEKTDDEFKGLNKTMNEVNGKLESVLNILKLQQ